MSVAPADPQRPHPVRVEQVLRDAHDTVTLSLVAADGSPERERFEPGQFNMLYLFGAGEVPISISGDPGQPEVLLHTIKSVGQVTRRLCALSVGATLGLRGPYGTAWPMDLLADRDVLIVAGGIGLAPLRPVLYRLMAAERTRPVILLYGARRPYDLLFMDELAHWQQTGRLELHATVDANGHGWTGHIGVVPALIGGLALDVPNTIALACGPEIMIRFTARALEKRGMSDEQIWVSMERNMHCAVGVCGHCQLGPLLICRDGPVLRHDRARPLMEVREL